MRTLGLVFCLGLVFGCGDKGDGDTSGTGSGSGTESTGETEGDTSPASGTGASGASSQGSASGSGSGGGLTCTRDEDCELLSDCCECRAVHVDGPHDVCNAGCDEAVCESQGVRAAMCRDGACVLRPVNCDDSTIICDVIPPECPDGFKPSVSEDGTCYTDKCTPTDLCA